MKPSSIQRIVKNLSILRVFQKMTETKKYLPKAGAIGERLHSTKCFAHGHMLRSIMTTSTN
jgi:hypothetical protein